MSTTSTPSARHEAVVEVVATLSASGRSVTFQGRKHRVVPATLVQSQVLKNNLGSCFLPPTELTDRWAAMWNGVGVLVGDHPSKRGVAVSARTPGEWDARACGFIFNAVAEPAPGQDGVRRLAAEVYLDESRAEDVPGLPAILERLEAGQPVELSTGFPALLELVEHTDYKAVMRPVGVDHLVVSTEFTGACSVEDGCGLGVNTHAHVRPSDDNLFTAGEGAMTPKKDCGCGTAANTEPGRWAALKTALVALFTKVVEGASAAVVTANTARTEFLANLALARLGLEIAILNAVPETDQDRQARLTLALQEQFGGEDKRVIIADVLSTAKEVVYWLSSNEGPWPPGVTYFKVSFTESGEGAEAGVTFGEPVEVRRVTAYEPISAGAGAAAPAAAADAPAATNTDGEEPKVEAAPKEGEEAPKVEGAPKEGEEEPKVETPAANTAPGDDLKAMLATLTQRLATLEKAVGTGAVPEPVATAIAALQEQVKVVQKDRETEHAGLVAELAAHASGAFTSDQLTGKSLEELRQLAKLARASAPAPVAGAQNFAGRGGPRAPVPPAPVAGNSAAPKFAEPVPYFQKPAAGEQK